MNFFAVLWAIWISITNFFCGLPLIGLIPFVCNTNAGDDNLNVVLFYADDWAANMLGIEQAAKNATSNQGNTVLIQTPHLDEMARNGVWFTKSYVTTSICWISRASLFTGMYSSVHQFLLLNDNSLSVRWADTLFYRLRNMGGFSVGFVGKWHAPMTIWSWLSGFDFYRAYYNAHLHNRNGVERHVTELNQADALEFLRNRSKRKRFALMVSYSATHTWDGKKYPDMYVPQPYTANLYSNSSTAPLPVTATAADFQNLPYFLATEQNLARQLWRNYGWDMAEKRQVTVKRLYRMAKEVDDTVGAIMEELKEQGVYDDTIFIFTSDNGLYQGEFQLHGKWYTHDESIRVPLIIQDPRIPVNKRGQVIDDVALNIDLLPTILSAASVKSPSGVQGRDLSELYLEQGNNAATTDTNWRQDWFFEWNRGSKEDAAGHGEEYRLPAVFALIQKDYKYIVWPQFGYEQLFNLANDPYEQFDILNETRASNNSLYLSLRSRYEALKQSSQSGEKV